MSLVHLHLVLNHAPVVGVALAILLLLYGILRRSQDVVRVALIGFVALAIITVPAYLTGEPAEKAINGHPGTAPAAIEVHENAATIALAAMEVVGALALIVLLLYRRRPLPTTAALTMLILAGILGGVMARTANLGGKIHHTEVASGAVPVMDEHDKD